MDHVNWTGRQMLKLASNFEMYIYFFVFCWIEKKDELLCNFCNDITQPFLDLEDAPKWQMHFRTTLKNPQQQNCFDIQ